MYMCYRVSLGQDNKTCGGSKSYVFQGYYSLYWFTINDMIEIVVHIELQTGYYTIHYANTFTSSLRLMRLNDVMVRK